MDSKKYRKLLKEISDGYSGFFINEKRHFIKHQATDDLVDFDDVYEMYFNRAISKGLPSEEQILEDLKEDLLKAEKNSERIAGILTPGEVITINIDAEFSNAAKEAAL